MVSLFEVDGTFSQIDKTLSETAFKRCEIIENWLRLELADPVWEVIVQVSLEVGDYLDETMVLVPLSLAGVSRPRDAERLTALYPTLRVRVPINIPEMTTPTP